MIKFNIKGIRSLFSFFCVMRMDCDCAASPAPAPDYTGISAANEKAAQLGYQAAADRLAFDKQVYDEKQPYTQALEQRALEIADQQKAMGDTNKASGDLQLQRYRDKGIPVEDRMYQEAMDYGSAADQEVEAAKAANTVTSQGEAQRQAATQRLEDLGIRPDSGVLAGTDAATGAVTAADAANAANSARTSVRDKGVALRAGAANFARGGTNAAATGYSTSIAAGNSSTGNMTAASNAGLPAAQLVDGGYGSGLQAAQIGSSSALGMGNVLNTGYGIAQGGVNSYNASQGGDSGLGSIIGTGLGIGMKYLAA